MVSKAVKKMNKGKVAGPSGIVFEMLKAAGEKAIEMVTGLINQIIKEGAVPVEWELNTSVNCCKGKL